MATSIITTMAATTVSAVMSGSRRVVVIAGPTAVGKSALALRLCELLQGELISVDSVQVYRGLQIGANKPSEQEMARVPHHIVDLRDPDEEYTAGAFYADALRAVDSVLARGRVRTDRVVAETATADMASVWRALMRRAAFGSRVQVADDG